MTKLKLLGAAAVVLSSALASPAMAQQVMSNPARCSQLHSDANCQRMGRNNVSNGDYQRRVAYRNSSNWNNDNWDNGWNDHRNSGFWPGDVAAGVVNGAIGTAGAVVGTAGAIAAAPFQGDSYAYYNDGNTNGWDNGWDNGWNNGYRQTYAQRNGFVCQPGTWFKGEDGRQHICQ